MCYSSSVENLNETGDQQTPKENVRTKIMIAAAGLIAKGGQDAATTRAIATAANVQAPSIYRLFGDKRGLLDAVAEHSLAAYMANKSESTPHPDPVQDLRDGWDSHIAFSLANPELFAIMSGDPLLHATSPAVEMGRDVLRRRIKAIALAGRLKVSEERAVALVQSAGVGIVLTLLGQPEDARDLELLLMSREAVIAAITGEQMSSDATTVMQTAVAALRASLDKATVLSAGEKQLFDEWLKRIANMNDAQ